MGCADGKTITDIKNSLSEFDCYGYDFSPVAIEAAKIKSPDVTFEVRDIILNPIKNNYGCVCILETIEHIEEGTNYKILDNILDHCEYAIISTVDTEDTCFGEHISHYKIDTFGNKGYDVIWKSFLSEIQMPDGIYHYMIFLLKGKL
jgi:2-polyprenyl-3-methyl-5-hydroxy-6-metoxy-1,4-benzoquinol methylase